MSKIIKFPSNLVDRIEVAKIVLGSSGSNYEPKNNNDAANKKYIDDKETALRQFITEKIGELTGDISSLGNALHFIGLTTTALSDKTTTNPVIVNGSSHTAIVGDVVLCDDKEFVFDGTKWLELGDGSSHALKTITITAGNGLTGGGDLSTNRTLNVGAGNGITVSDDAVAAKAGNGITVDSSGINHAVPTTVATNVTANGRQYITGVTLDTYGHVTGLTTGTETIIDTNDNQTITGNGTAFGANAVVNIVGSGATTVTADTTNNKITISSTEYSSKAAVNSGTEVSLVTTGEKYLWNNKQDVIDSSNKIEASNISGLAAVATSGSYTDLSNTPAIPEAVTETTVTNWGFIKTAPAHNQAANTITSMTAYSKPTSTSAIATTDSLNTAIGKLESALDNKADNDHNHDNTSPTFTAVTAQSFNATSDARLKENFEALRPEKSILELPTYKFDFINGAKNQIGCKAQDLQEICPELVVEKEDGYLAIQETKLVYLLLEEVKNLKAELDALKNK